jgi:hypothetical protein
LLPKFVKLKLRRIVKKRLLLPVLFFMFLNAGLHAQRGSGLVDKSRETTSYLIFSAGPEYCNADTQNTPSLKFNSDNTDLSLGFRKLFSNNLAYKVSFNYSHFMGNDSGYIKLRRYGYSSKVFQFAIQGEYHIKIGRSYYYKPTPNSIYVFLGIGGLKSIVDLNTNNDKRGDYIYKPSFIAPVIPFGIGYQYNFNNNFLIGAEFNVRYPFSDYIDGFKPPKDLLQDGSKRGSLSNDVMSGFSITLTYLLGNEYLKRN